MLFDSQPQLDPEFSLFFFFVNFDFSCSLIGYLVGTAIAWFVVIGDVAPAVLSSLLGTEVSSPK